MQHRWRTGPATITLVRHGESVGNLADTRARDDRAERLDLDARDADVELSPNGRDQADALAAWLDTREGQEARPDLVVSSPYRRAAETAERALSRTGISVAYDERLRERDLGVFDGLTGLGIREQYPEEAERRSRLGKFYYQPPSGESWCDVVLRVRGLLRDLDGIDATRLWLVTHQAVIMSIRYVLEELTEQDVLDIDRTMPLPNASLTEYERDGDGYLLRRFADASIVEERAAKVTDEPGAHHRSGEDELGETGS